MEESRKRDEEGVGVSLRSSDSDSFSLRLCLFDASLPLPLGPLTYGHEFYDFATSSVPFQPHFCYLVLGTRPPPTLSSRQDPTASSPHHIHTSALTPNTLPPSYSNSTSTAFLPPFVFSAQHLVRFMDFIAIVTQTKPTPYRIVFYYLNRYVPYICSTHHPQNELRCSRMDELNTSFVVIISSC